MASLLRWMSSSEYVEIHPSLEAGAGTSRRTTCQVRRRSPAVQEEVPSQQTSIKNVDCDLLFRPGLKFLSGVAHHFSLGTA